jgi:hypothetical protein
LSLSFVSNLYLPPVLLFSFRLGMMIPKYYSFSGFHMLVSAYMPQVIHHFHGLPYTFHGQKLLWLAF